MTLFQLIINEDVKKFCLFALKRSHLRDLGAEPPHLEIVRHAIDFEKQIKSTPSKIYCI